MGELDFSRAGVRRLPIKSRKGNPFPIDITADLTLKLTELAEGHVAAEGKDAAIVRDIFGLLGLPIDEFELDDMDTILERIFKDLAEDDKPGVKKKRPAGGSGPPTSSGTTAVRSKNGRRSRRKSGKSSKGK